MREFAQLGGALVTFDTSAVVLYAPHTGGTGTKVILGPVERWTELHLEADYDALKRAIEAGAA
jgi:ribosomal protein L14